MVAQQRVSPDVRRNCQEAETGLHLAGCVLLAEDDEQMCLLLAETLRRGGFEVVPASNGSELIEKIRSLRGQVLGGRFFDVDLIVSDVRMPRISGLEVLRHIRLADHVTPVILITAFGDERTHAEAYDLGASAVLDKPFDLDLFLEVVRRYVPDRCTPEAMD